MLAAQGPQAKKHPRSQSATDSPSSKKTKATPGTHRVANAEAPRPRQSTISGRNPATATAEGSKSDRSKVVNQAGGAAANEATDKDKDVSESAVDAMSF